MIGLAADFYRLRVVRVDETDEPDLDWRDDILWRDPPEQVVGETLSFRVEAVEVDDETAAVPLAEFADSATAHEALADAEVDLATLTKSQFEERYFPA